MYPRILKKENPIISQTRYLRNKAGSKILICSRIVVFRSRIKAAATSKTKKEMMPVMRRDQASDRFSIIGVVAAEKMTPPKPEPAAAMP